MDIEQYGGQIGFFRQMILALLISLSSISGLKMDCAVAEESKDFLNVLLRQLKGGSIEVLSIDRANVKISQKEAVRVSQECLGLKIAAKHSWLVSVTDQEFIGGMLKAKVCWLLQYDHCLFQSSDENESKYRKNIFAVIDADTGIFWEAFTMPSNAWWARMSFKNADVIKRFAKWGEKAVPVRASPKTPIEEVVNKLGEKFQWYQSRAQQVIVRHFRYTNCSQGVAIHRIDGLEIIPQIDKRSVWFVSFEGVRTPWQGSVPPGVNASTLPNTEEINIFIDAKTGKLLNWFEYR